MPKKIKTVKRHTAKEKTDFAKWILIAQAYMDTIYPIYKIAPDEVKVRLRQANPTLDAILRLVD